MNRYDLGCCAIFVLAGHQVIDGRARGRRLLLMDGLGKENMRITESMYSK